MNFLTKKRKLKGFLMAQAALAMVLVGMFAVSFMQVYGGQFSMIQAGRTALAAQQYADIDADTLKLLSYDDLDEKGAHPRQPVAIVSDATDWEDEITISAEKSIDDGTQAKQRIATIKVYKTGDTLARYSLQVPLSTKGSSIRKGMILAYRGDIHNIPAGWYLCDGSNGTPDLRNRFILGAGVRAVGETGGAETHTLTIPEMPSHNHNYYLDYEDLGEGGGQMHRVADGYGYASPGGHYPVQHTDSTGGNQPHSIMNPYYTLAYIMRK